MMDSAELAAGDPNGNLLVTPILVNENPATCTNGFDYGLMDHPHQLIKEGTL
jgi:hypothetical protein